MIEIEKLSYGYSKAATVIADFEASYKPGIHIFMGYSGCGKTTLLKLIAGLLRPNQGSITHNGKPVGGSLFLRESLGYVFQDLNLLPDATLRRNMEICASLKPSNSDSLDSRIDALAERLGLTDLMDSKPGLLSLGQQQRAAVLRAMVHNPEILIMDEPTSSLDDLNTQVIKRVIHEFVATDSNRTVFIATHDDRLKSIANEIHDFNQFLPLDRHLEAVAGADK